MKHQLEPRLVWILILVLASSSVLVSALAPAAPSYNPDELSYGIYWFSDGANYRKFDPDGANPNFDPANPTLIFVHGWQPYLSQTLPNFMFNSTDTVAAWIADGWNVGIFAWNQFSDETTDVGVGDDWFASGPPEGVLDAEAKIWTPNGPRGMRWRDHDDDDPLPIPDGYSDAPPGTPSAAELFYQEYVAAMPVTYTGNIRIAGHSLGNQMAVRLTKLVDEGIAAGEVPERLRPTRVALLDPYWSPAPRNDLTDGETAGRKTGDVVRETIAELLPTGTLFEWYWSSEWTTGENGDDNDALKPMTMYAAMDPAYATTGKDKHMAPRYLYFWAYEFPQSPPCIGVGDDCRLLGQMSDDQLASLMRSDYRWAQSEGGITSTPSDDVYTSTQQAGAPYVVTALQTDTSTQTPGGVITVTATVTSTASPAPDGTLVTFNADLGAISARSVTSGGVAMARITSDVTGTAHISATTKGAGGTVQSTAVVTFTDCLTPLTGVRIDGPLNITGTLYIDTLYTFDAIITPTDASLPITYTWSPTPTNGQNHDTATYQWPVSGTYAITLTAENCGGPVDAEPRMVHIAYQENKYIYLPLVLRNHS